MTMPKEPQSNEKPVWMVSTLMSAHFCAFWSITMVPAVLAVRSMISIWKSCTARF